MQNSPQALMVKAALARKEGRLDDAHRDLTAAVAGYRSNGPAGLARALMALGQIERDQKRADRALPLYEEAVALYRESGESLDFAHAARHLGDLHLDAGRLEEAGPYYREALGVYRRHPDARLLDLANALRPMAILSERVGNVAGAIELWREARNLYVAAGVTAGSAESSKALGRLTGA